jgi:sortase A
MIRVNLSKNNRYKKKKFLLLQFVAIAVILFGFVFGFTNLYKFSKGYFAGQQAATLIQAEDVTSANITSSETDYSKILQKLLSDTKAFSPKKGLETELYPARPETGENIGEIYIPKLDVTLPIYEGSNEEELDKGVGHYSGSVLPGENDNCVLAGHRDTVFRKLGEVGEGDLLIVRTSAGEFEYKVSKVRIVDKEDRTVIVPKPKATLTVSTCYPFVYIGSAPQRYILVAYLVSETSNQ